MILITVTRPTKELSIRERLQKKMLVERLILKKNDPVRLTDQKKEP